MLGLTEADTHRVAAGSWLPNCPHGMETQTRFSLARETSQESTIRLGFLNPLFTLQQPMLVL